MVCTCGNQALFSLSLTCQGGIILGSLPCFVTGWFAELIPNWHTCVRLQTAQQGRLASWLLLRSVMLVASSPELAQNNHRPVEATKIKKANKTTSSGGSRRKPILFDVVQSLLATLSFLNSHVLFLSVLPWIFHSFLYPKCDGEHWGRSQQCKPLGKTSSSHNSRIPFSVQSGCTVPWLLLTFCSQGYRVIFSLLSCRFSCIRRTEETCRHRLPY